MLIRTRMPALSMRVPSRAIASGRAIVAGLALGANCIALGDSHTDGRGTGDCRSPMRAFHAIATQNSLGLGGTVTHNGASGESLRQSKGRWDLIASGTRTAATLVVIQESGNQDLDGQRTASEYETEVVNTVEDMMLDSPDAIFVFEKAFNFGRTSSYRVWHQPYNDALVSAKNTIFSNTGRTVYIAETDSIIKALQTSSGKSPGDFWFQAGDANEYHFNNLGNFGIALGIYRALGYSVNAFDLSNMTQIGSTDRQLCVDVAMAH